MLPRVLPVVWLLPIQTQLPPCLVGVLNSASCPHRAAQVDFNLEHSQEALTFTDSSWYGLFQFSRQQKGQQSWKVTKYFWPRVCWSTWSFRFMLLLHSIYQADRTTAPSVSVSPDTFCRCGVQSVTMSRHKCRRKNFDRVYKEEVERLLFFVNDGS